MTLSLTVLHILRNPCICLGKLHIQQFPFFHHCLKRIHRSAEECIEGEAKAGVADDVESEEKTEHEEQLYPCDTTSV